MTYNSSNKNDNSRNLTRKGDLGSKSNFDNHNDGTNDKRLVKEQDYDASSYCSVLKKDNSKRTIAKRCSPNVKDYSARINDIEDYKNPYSWAYNTKEGSSRDSKDFYIPKSSPLVDYNPNTLAVEDASIGNNGLIGIFLIIFFVCTIVACFIGGLIGLFRSCVIKPNKEDEQDEKIVFSNEFELKV